MLNRQFARSVRDNLLAECAIQILRLGGMVVLARALGAAQFGVFKVLAVICALSGLTTGVGVTEALIQRKELTPDHEATAWWLSLGFAFGTSATLFAAAPWISRVMAMPTLSVGLRVICPAVFLDCICATANAKLQREMRFGVLAIAEVMAEIAFMATALPLLWTTLARWSLMAGLGARLAVRALCLMVAQPVCPRTRPTIEALNDMRRFALTAWSGSLLQLLSANADFLLIGRLLGASALGFYSLAWDLLRFVPDRLHRVAGRVTFPAFCLLQDDDEKLAGAYRDFFAYMARIVIPIVACAAAAAPELIAAIYGARWLPAATPLRLLSVGLILLGLRTGMGPLYFAKNRPSMDVYLHSARLLLIVIAVYCLAPIGLAGVSGGMSVIETVISVAGITVACSLCGLPTRTLAAALIPALRLTAACLTATLAAKAIITLTGCGGPVALAALIIPPAVIFYLMEAPTLSAMIASAFSREPQAAEVPR